MLTIASGFVIYAAMHGSLASDLSLLDSFQRDKMCLDSSTLNQENLTAYIRNTGTNNVFIQSVYIDSVRVEGPGSLIELNSPGDDDDYIKGGKVGVLTVHKPDGFKLGKEYQVKIVSRENSVLQFTEYTEPAYSQLTVHAPTGTEIYVYKGSSVVASGVASSAVTMEVEYYDDYLVKMKYNDKWYQYTHVNCTTRKKVLDKSYVTVRFPGMKLNQIRVETSSGGLVTYKNGKSDEYTFQLDYAAYDVVLKHGATSKRVEDAFILGEVIIDDVTCTLDVEFDGMRLNQIRIETLSGGLVTYKNGRTDSWTVTLLKGTYDVELRQGAITKLVESVDCTGSEKTLSGLTCQLGVDFDGLRLNQIRIENTGGSLVTYKNGARDSWEFTLLKGTYDVELRHGAISKLVEDVNCTADNEVLTNFTCELTIDFDGMRLNQIRIETLSGGLVTYKNGPRNSWKVTLLKGVYDVELIHGALTNLIEEVECTNSDKLLTEITCELTIRFDGTRLDQVRIETNDGSLVTYKNGPRDSWTVTLLRNSYDVELRQGSTIKTVENVDCTNSTKELIVNFP
jgi:hypothetical protein